MLLTGLHRLVWYWILVSHFQFFATLWTVACQAPLSMEFKNTGTSCHSLLWGGGSSPPRDWTWVYLIASQFFTFWATREAECGTSGREPVCHAGDIRSVGFISGSRKSPGGGHRNPLQYSCLENPTDRGAWWATVQRVANRWTWLKQFNTYKGMLLPGEFLLPSKDKQWLAIYVGLSTVEGIGLH